MVRDDSFARMLRDMRQVRLMLVANIALSALTLGVLVDRVWR